MTDIPIDLPAWVRPPVDTHTPPVARGVPVICAKWHNTHFRIVPGGITVRCKSCRGEIEFHSWEKLDAMRKEVDAT